MGIPNPSSLVSQRQKSSPSRGESNRCLTCQKIWRPRKKGARKYLSHKKRKKRWGPKIMSRFPFFFTFGAWPENWTDWGRRRTFGKTLLLLLFFFSFRVSKCINGGERKRGVEKGKVGETDENLSATRHFLDFSFNSTTEKLLICF